MNGREVETGKCKKNFPSIPWLLVLFPVIIIIMIMVMMMMVMINILLLMLLYDDSCDCYVLCAVYDRYRDNYNHANLVFKSPLQSTCVHS